MISTISDIPKAYEDIPEDSYYNPKTKLYHCNKCGTPKQCMINWMGTPHTVQCMCDCESGADRKSRAEHKRRNRAIEISRNRDTGIPGVLQNKTFEYTDVEDENRKIIEIAKKYVEDFDECFKENIGLKFYGTKGSGKTHIAACIANALVDRGYRVYMRTMDYLINSVQGTFQKNDIIDDICSYDLLVIDEFGSERGTETAVQYVYDIINARLLTGKPFIVTTNLAHPDEAVMTLEQKRIYSRFNETLMSIRCVGRDRREEIAIQKKEKFKKLLEGIKDD